jgi:type VI secretion system protein ImpK
MSNDGKDPFAPVNATVMRPRPGAGKRGAAEPPAPPTAAPPPRYAATPNAAAGPLPGNLASGLNALVQAASPLLILAGRLRGTVQATDTASLRRQALDEVRRFEEQAAKGGVVNEVVLAARYALCAALDEAVLTTPWGAQSEWSQQTLLVTLHREAWGGEKFFEMLERTWGDPARWIDVMELQYLCIALGFAGKYQVQERGQARLAEIQHELYRRIREHRGSVPPVLSLRWEGLKDTRNPLLRLLPWWVLAAAGLVLLTIAFAFFYARLGNTAAPLETQLAKIGLSDFTKPVVSVAPPAGPTLKELLAGDERAGTLKVEEQGGRTLITLVAPNLFESASATVNPTYYQTLQHIANALDQVPGRVLVTGHTDDQPVRSLRYRDNFELSRERAVAVVDMLKLAIDNKARLEWTGVGATEPRYTPASLPENRARNRRVEITHMRER